MATFTATAMMPTTMTIGFMTTTRASNITRSTLQLARTRARGGGDLPHRSTRCPGRIQSRCPRNPR